MFTFRIFPVLLLLITISPVLLLLMTISAVIVCLLTQYQIRVLKLLTLWGYVLRVITGGEFCVGNWSKQAIESDRSDSSPPRSPFPHVSSHACHSSSQPMHKLSKQNPVPSSRSEQMPNDVSYNGHPSHFSSAASVDHSFCRDRESSAPFPPFTNAAAGSLASISERGGISNGERFWTQQERKENDSIIHPPLTPRTSVLASNKHNRHINSMHPPNTDAINNIVTRFLGHPISSDRLCVRSAHTVLDSTNTYSRPSSVPSRPSGPSVSSVARGAHLHIQRLYRLPGRRRVRGLSHNAHFRCQSAQLQPLRARI